MKHLGTSMACIGIQFGFLHCRFVNDSRPPLINDRCSKFGNLTLNSWNANMLNAGTPRLNKVTTAVSTSDFKNERVEIKFIENNSTIAQKTIFPKSSNIMETSK